MRRAARRHRRGLQIDRLEPRQLLSYVEAAPAVQVNQVSDNNQFGAIAAARPGGAATVVWWDNGLDSSGYGVYARRLDDRAQSAGNHFRVNSRFEGNQTEPTIGADGAGNTIVVWRDDSPGSQGLYYQRYDANGQKIGENTFLSGTADHGPYFALVVDPDGSFSIPTSTYERVTGDYFMTVRRFDADGKPLGQFDNTVARPGWFHSYAGELGPRVRKSGDTFLFPWAEWRTRAIPDVGQRNDGRAWIRRLDSEGNSLGPDILLASIDEDTHNAPPYMSPSVVPLANGGFLGTWYEYATRYTDAYARRYDADGRPVGNRITLAHINHGGYGYGHSVRVAELGNGNLLTTWVNEVAFEADSSVYRVLRPDGTPLTDAIPVGSASGYYQTALDITPLEGADFLLTWGSGEVYAQKYIDRTTVELAAATATVSEGAGQLAVTVTRTGDLSQPATVTIDTLDETATPGFDYRTTSGLVEFDAGEAEQIVLVPILQDSTVEEPETFRVQLGTVTGISNYPGDVLSMKVTIQDDDTGGGGGGGTSTLQFASATSQAGEGSETTTILVTRTGDTAQAGSARYSVTGGSATAGSDFALASGVLEFAPGVASKPIAVTILNDELDEADETIVVTLSQATGTGVSLGAITSSTLTILDDDGTPPPPASSVAFDPVSYQITESPLVVSLTVRRSGSTDSAGSVRYSVVGGSATQAVDFVLAAGVLDFPVGQTTRTIGVSIISDGDVESDETIVVALSDPTGPGLTISAAGAATVTLFDDDAPPPPPPIEDVTPPRVLGFEQKIAGKQIAGLVVHFSEPLAFGSAQDVSHYTLTPVGKGAKALRIQSAVYNPADNSVFLKVRKGLQPGQKFQLSVQGVLDAAGNALDGDRDGTAGGLSFFPGGCFNRKQLEKLLAINPANGPKRAPAPLLRPVYIVSGLRITRWDSDYVSGGGDRNAALNHLRILFNLQDNFFQTHFLFGANRSFTIERTDGRVIANRGTYTPRGDVVDFTGWYEYPPGSNENDLHTFRISGRLDVKKKTVEVYRLTDRARATGVFKDHDIQVGGVITLT